jgi:multiple sugar transport system permease protein
VNIFDQAYVLNSTATSGSSIMLKTYQVTFSNLDFGQGYALSLVATALTALITVATVALIYRRVSY